MLNAAEIETKQSDASKVLASATHPTPEEFAMLSSMERFAFRVSHRMNRGRAKRFWTFCQRTLGVGWIHLATYNLMRIYGIEHLDAVSHARPVLIVANHRSFFDMYVVSTVLFRRTRWQKKLFFPVRSTFFYDSLSGMFVNLVMGWWSMYPPFFSHGGKRSFDDFTMRHLSDLCRTGAGHVIGFHPEGKRNLTSDPYTLLRAQPGIGKIIKEAQPQVVPVFVAGLGNNLWQQVKGNWTGGEKIRVHFGAPLDLSAYSAKRDSVRTYKEITDFVMNQITELGEQDRLLQHAVEAGAQNQTAARTVQSSSGQRESS